MRKATLSQFADLTRDLAFLSVHLRDISAELSLLLSENFSLLPEECFGRFFLSFEDAHLLFKICGHNNVGKKIMDSCIAETNHQAFSYCVRIAFLMRLKNMLNYPPLLLAFSVFFAGCSASAMQDPIPQSGTRPTVLTFGLRVTPDPEDNPISPPERFSGYHVATDFEVTKEELDQDISVFAICSGKVLSSGFAEGYGGLIIQRCVIRGETVTVLYGHLSLASLPKTGTKIIAGKQLGILGAARSHDTDGNRKHLHLGIHRGTAIDMRGYVQTEEEVNEYIDPLTVIPGGAAIQNLGPDMIPYWETGTGIVVHP